MTTYSNKVAERFLEPKTPTRTLTIGAVPHSYDGSSYYRMWLPFKNISDQSFHNSGVASPETAHLLDAKQVEAFDVLALQRPAGVLGMQLVEKLLGHTKLVYEVDDDMLQADPSGLPHLTPEKSKETIRRCLRMCDAVTVTNPYLADVYRPFNDRIYVLPNYVKARLLTMPRTRRPRLVIGWGGGTTHLIDMVTVQEPLRQVLDDHPDVEMHWIGQDFSPLVGRLGVNCRWTMWDADVGHYYQNIDFDIAIAPAADIPFNNSKTPIRALEMAALGIPIVAQNRPPYSDFVVDGKTGFLVDTPAGWRHALELLIRDPDLRDEMGQAAHAQAEEWTIEEHWTEWVDAYEDIARA